MVKRAARLIAAAVLAMVVALALGFGLIQTRIGRDWLAREIAAQLSDPQQQVRIEGLAGLVPFNMQVGAIAISDAAGPLLTVSNAHLALSGRDLLRGRLSLSIDVDRVALVRTGQSQGSPPSWDTLLRPPLPLEIRRFAIHALSLGEGIIGTAVTVSADGSLAVASGRADADLAVARIDGAPGRLSLHLAYDGRRLALAANASDPTGTILPALLQRDDKLPLDVELQGDGPIADWHGTLSARAGAASSVGARLAIAGTAPYRLTLDGEAHVAPLLPAAWQSLLGDSLRLSATARLSDDVVSLDGFALAARALTASAAGSYSIANDGITGRATVTLPDLAAARPLIGQPIAGAGNLQLTLEGTGARPVVTADLGLDHLSAPQASIAHVDASVALRPAGDPRTAPIALTVTGHIEGLELAEGGLPSLLGAAIDWQVQAQIDPQRQTATVTDFRVRDAGATLVASASASAVSAEGEARLDIPDLAPFAVQGLRGALAAAADFHFASDGTGTAVIAGSIEHPATGNGTLDAVLGPRASFGGTFSRAADGALTGTKIALDAAAAHVSGTIGRAADGGLSADITAALSRLATLDPRLSGAAQADIHLSGPTDKLAGTIALAAPSITVLGRPVKNLSARATIANLMPLSAHLEARLRVSDQDAAVTADATTSSGGALQVSRLEMTAGSARLRGSFSSAADKFEGKLGGTIPDLAPFARIAGVRASGRADLDASLTDERLTLTLDTTDLANGDRSAAAQHVHLTADLRAPFTRPSGHAELAVTGALIDKARIDAAQLSARSDKPGHFIVTTDAKGRVNDALSLTAAADLGIGSNAVDLNIGRLDASLGATRLGLAQPLAITWRNDVGRFSGLALRLGSGRIEGSGAIERNALSLQLTGRAVPVNVLADLAGGGTAEGDLAFDATLSGTRAAPRGQLVIDAERLRFATATHPDLPPLGLVTRADWQNGRVEFAGRLAGPQNRAVGWRGSVPLILAQDFTPHLPPNGAIALHLEGNGEFADIVDLLPLGEDRFTGSFAINADVAGTVASPSASGRITVDNGRYENVDTGVILSNIRLALVGNNDRFDLAEFAADDGGKGVLRLRGGVELADRTITASAELQHFLVLHRDEGTATATGAIALSGTLAAPRLAATLTIDQADLAVPNRLPQSARPVEAVKINSRTGRVITPPAAATRPVVLPVALDVTVTLPGRTFVRGRGLDSEWRGRITITGTSAAPILSGALNIAHGTYDFIGTSFTLTNGTIKFQGNQKIDPAIDIRATAQSNDITAVVQIAGTATQPTIALSSQPDLPRDEVLSRLLFGASMSQIGPAQGVAIASAAAQLAGGSDIDVLGSIRRNLGLDRLSLGSAPTSVVPGIGVPTIAGQPASGPAAGFGTTPLTPGATSTSTTAGAALNAGKYVANGVYVGVSQGLGTGSSTATVSVDVTRHITIDTEAGQASGSGVGVNWKLDY